ncbi:carbohydrate ABC transporter permease [Anaerocolumna sp. MB42-C2]|uniref:carbohydrate ABC transporter permease n=1 Tax=Anaerocolumna sp. MB42-C2 TaxID=3070997 RepID=UPI0027E07795|nr:carbohydrate ABC transporter permease [Anaerocolumna sp. MB42-C2]WMJ85989.1 carbohydrate ABC transporter permease [Anaerocolumna sp. MB42-C2]
MKQKFNLGKVILTALSVLIALIFVTPVIWSLAVSFQREGKQIKNIWDWFKPPYTIENYPSIIFHSDVPTWMLNSLFISIISTFLVVLLSALAAYAIAKIDMKGKGLLYVYFLLGLMVPGEATIVPLFITANKLNLIDTYPGLIFPTIAGSMNLIIMITFFRGIPGELLESVRIDGGGELVIFTRIVLPLSKVVLVTVAIFAFVGSWNNYLWPLLCSMSSEKFTLPIGIPTFAGTYTVDYVRPMTANMVASLPAIILFILFEKQIVTGITMTGVKG